MEINCAPITFKTRMTNIVTNWCDLDPVSTLTLNLKVFYLMLMDFIFFFFSFFFGNLIRHHHHYYCQTTSGKQFGRDGSSYNRLSRSCYGHHQLRLWHRFAWQRTAENDARFRLCAHLRCQSYGRLGLCRSITSTATILLVPKDDGRSNATAHLVQHVVAVVDSQCSLVGFGARVVGHFRFVVRLRSLFVRTIVRSIVFAVYRLCHAEQIRSGRRRFVRESITLARCRTVRVSGQQLVGRRTSRNGTSS